MDGLSCLLRTIPQSSTRFRYVTDVRAFKGARLDLDTVHSDQEDKIDQTTYPPPPPPENWGACIFSDRRLVLHRFMKEGETVGCCRKEKLDPALTCCRGTFFHTFVFFTSREYQLTPPPENIICFACVFVPPAVPTR